MSYIERTFRLNNVPGSLGVGCRASGLTLAGVSLLRPTERGLVPRPAAELAVLFAAAYHGGIDPTSRLATLDVVAKALNRGDLQLAMVAAVLLELPELDWDAAARLAEAADRLAKYDKDEPRDADGEWTDEDGEDADPVPAIAHDPRLDPEVARILKARTPEFQQRYDYLGPVEFAEAAIEFGYQLGAKAGGYSLPERQAALAEYEFVQDRLNFWLGYDFKPQNSQGNLQSAALSLYQGAVGSGLVPVGGHLGGLPPSMLDVAGAAIWNDGAQLTAGLNRTPLSLAGTVPLRETERIGEVGGIVGEKAVDIKWNNGVLEQGFPWEIFLDKVIPGIRRLPPGSKTFDRYYAAEREAISDKTLNTLSVYYVKNPQRIYGVLKRYVDATTKYKPRTQYDLAPADIDKRSIHLAVPDFTSAEQWRHVMRAILYARQQKVTLVVTRLTPK